MTSRVTIKDVAKHAGVSFKTVARVANNEPSVQESYRIKVLQSIKELDYQVDVAARNLRAKRSFAIGLVYDHPLAHVQNGVLSACQSMGYSLQIQPCDPKRPGIGQKLCDEVKRSRLSGLVLTPPISEMPSVIETLQDNSIYFAAIVSAIDPPQVSYPCIYVNDHQAACEITKHLIDLGHKRIGFLWGDASHRSSQERFLGYEEALKKQGIQVEENLVVRGEYTFDSGRRNASKLLKQGNRPTAIIGSNDEIAAGAIVAARIANIDVPSELSIAGFEDSPFSRCSWPAITTARQPTEGMARQATLLLIEEMSRPTSASSKPISDLNKGFMPELVVKASTTTVSENTF